MLCQVAPTGGKRRVTMNNGSALIHINGVEYPLVGQYTGKDSPEFQRVVERIEAMVKRKDGQVQQFDVLIGGNAGQLMVKSSELVSAAVVFVPDLDPQVY
jgi:hypothetical protein